MSHVLANTRESRTIPLFGTKVQRTQVNPQYFSLGRILPTILFYFAGSLQKLLDNQYRSIAVNPIASR